MSESESEVRIGPGTFFGLAESGCETDKQRISMGRTSMDRSAFPIEAGQRKIVSRQSKISASDWSERNTSLTRLRCRSSTSQRDAEALGSQPDHESQATADIAGLAHALHGCDGEAGFNCIDTRVAQTANRKPWKSSSLRTSSDMLLPLVAKTESDRKRLLLRGGFVAPTTPISGARRSFRRCWPDKTSTR